MFKIYGPADNADNKKHAESGLFTFIKYAGIVVLVFWVVAWFGIKLSEYCWGIT